MKKARPLNLFKKKIFVDKNLSIAFFYKNKHENDKLETCVTLVTIYI